MEENAILPKIVYCVIKRWVINFGLLDQVRFDFSGMDLKTFYDKHLFFEGAIRGKYKLYKAVNKQLGEDQFE